MPGYDLYGQYYESELEAINAETSQMNEIVNAKLKKENENFKKRLEKLEQQLKEKE